MIWTKSNICLNIKACQTYSRFADQSYLVNLISGIKLFIFKLHENVYYKKPTCGPQAVGSHCQNLKFKFKTSIWLQRFFGTLLSCTENFFNWVMILILTTVLYTVLYSLPKIKIIPLLATVYRVYAVVQSCISWFA